MVKRFTRCLALMVLAFLMTETAAIAQSAAGQIAAVRLLDGCRLAQFIDVIFVGTPLGAVTRDGRLIPVKVERAFRGINGETVSLSWRGDSPLNAGQSYLMFGLSASGGSVVELQGHMPAAEDVAQRAIHLFNSAMPQRGYVTLMGLAEVGRHPDYQPSLPLKGLRIRVTSEAFATELVTEPDGTFSAAGIPPGRLELKPFLPDNLKVFDVKTLTYTAGANECVLLNFFVVSAERGR